MTRGSPIPTGDLISRTPEAPPEPEGEKTRRTSYLKVGVYSLLLNAGLATAKLALSSLTGSLALRADALHSGVDIFGSLALILGLVVANRKSAEFPYGLYKAENVVAVIISLLLFVSAFEIVSAAVAGETAIVPYHGWVLAAVGALVLAPFFFGRYEIGVGRKYNSPSLVAEGKQFRADVLSASIVFFALLGQTFGVPLDRVAAGIVAGFIAYSGWGLLRNGMRVLLDASVGGETLARIRTLIESQPEVGRVLHLTGRNSGRYMFIETAVAMRVTDLRQAHQVSERLERLVKDAEPSVDRVIIHYEPQTRTVIRYAFPLVSRGEQISKHFGEAPYFAVVDVDTERRRAVRHEILANPHAALEKGKGLQVARFLLGRKVDVVVTRESLAGKGPGYAFAEAGAETRQTDAGVIDEFLRQEGIQTTP